MYMADGDYLRHGSHISKMLLETIYALRVSIGKHDVGRRHTYFVGQLHKTSLMSNLKYRLKTPSLGFTDSLHKHSNDKHGKLQRGRYACRSCTLNLNKTVALASGITGHLVCSARHQACTNEYPCHLHFAKPDDPTGSPKTMLSSCLQTSEISGIHNLYPIIQVPMINSFSHQFRIFSYIFCVNCNN